MPSTNNVSVHPERPNVFWLALAWLAQQLLSAEQERVVARLMPRIFLSIQPLLLPPQLN